MNQRMSLPLARMVFVLAATVPAFSSTPASLQDHVATGAPVIDGTIEPLWNAAARLTSMVQHEPNYLPGTEDKTTQVWIMHDKVYLYVAARMTQKGTRSAPGRRDSQVVTEGDSFSFAVDTSGTGNTAFYFTVNPSNAVQDGIVFSDGTLDLSWDAPFESATKVDEEGWSVEIRIPLASLGYQSGQRQSWGFLARRALASERRVFLSSVKDPNRPYDPSTFLKIENIAGLGIHQEVFLTPYVFSNHVRRLGEEETTSTKGGADLRWRPLANLTVLGTVNPDYAQLESDMDIINVTDVPTSYPEKRPFFTESSDLYPGLAVNTRNIQDIRSGMKVRQVLPTLKYDVTAVEETNGARWLLGDARWTDNQTFLVEAISGRKDHLGDHDYNITTNIRGWWFDKRLSAYTWVGVVNGRIRNQMEWENVNAVRWDSRTFSAGLWGHRKSTFYYPGIVGSHTLSNEIIVKPWAEWTFYSDTRVLRNVKTHLEANNFRLYEGAPQNWTVPSITTSAVLNFGESLGDWGVSLLASPRTSQWFRYRGSAVAEKPLADGFGAFALVPQRAGEITATINTDPARRFSLKASQDHYRVRDSPAHSLGLEFTWKFNESGLVALTGNQVRLSGSTYQAPLTERVQRLKAEWNPLARVNLRWVLDLHTWNMPGAHPTDRSIPTGNVTGVWEFHPGSFLHVIAGKTWTDERQGADLPLELKQRETSVGVKLSYRFNLNHGIPEK